MVHGLICAGHAPADVWGYTPRQIVAFGELEATRRNRALADAIVAARLGSAFGPEAGRAVDKILKDLEGG